MAPLIEPGDLLLFAKDKSLRVGRIILFKSSDGLWCIKQVKHHSGNFHLHSFDPSIDDVLADGEQYAYLRGILKGEAPNQDAYYREQGNFADLIARFF